MALGTAGAIRSYKTDTGARVLVRDYDGHVRAVERNAASKVAAERALKLALRDRAPGRTGGEVTADSRVSVLAEAWYTTLDNLSPITLQAYRDRLDRQLLPRLGQLRIRELSVGILNRHLRDITDQHGIATARMCDQVDQDRRRPPHSRAPFLVHADAPRTGATPRFNGGRVRQPVFPALLGSWRDPSNTQADLRNAFTAAGFDWVTTHAFRKTVATLMDHAGLSARAAADQLGHANTSMTTDVYFGRKVAATGAAAVLEALDHASTGM